MAIESKAAADEIMAAYEATVPAGGRGAMPADFCKIWPQAKPILELLSSVVLLIPGLGAVAAGVLRGLIGIGDKIAADICKT